jgi:hypothetical protein
MQAILVSAVLRLAALTVLLLALGASPAAAATVEPLKPCYVSAGPAAAERETVLIRGQGFTPMSAVEVLFDGVAMGSALTGSAGEFQIQFPAPHQPTGARTFTVTVRDAVNEVAQAPRVTNLGMTVKPRRAAPRRRVRFRGRGFTRDAPVFAHYLFGGEEQKTVRLARRSNRPCGTFSAKRRLIPIDGARSGRWTLQVDQRRRYSPEPDPVWVRRPIDVVTVSP